MVRGQTLFGAGQLPKFQDNLYKDHEEDCGWCPPRGAAYRVAYGRHPGRGRSAAHVHRLHALLPAREDERRRDVRGIKRGHQFDKVEMYIYSKPEESETICRRCAQTPRRPPACWASLPGQAAVHRDIGFGSAITYDIEVWAAGCQEWLEVSSVSNVTDFQARRANIKYRRGGRRARYVHTLNGSGLGMPRTLIAVLENNQQADGSVVVPEVLRPWMGGSK